METHFPPRGDYQADETPKLWRDMTDAEKGALLLAKHEGKVIEFFDGDKWAKPINVVWYDWNAYRVKPEHVRETVVRYGSPQDNWWLTSKQSNRDTHRITFDLIDGKPDCSTIKMEKITCEEGEDQ